jgi:pyruvate,water dikinase
MTPDPKRRDILLHDLQERAKELNCLYQVGELLARSDWPIEQMLQAMISILPAGWQYPGLCQARITFEGTLFQPDNFVPSIWAQSVTIVVQDQPVGTIEISYREELPPCDEGPFLREERKLLQTIADRVADTIMQRRLKAAFEGWGSSSDSDTNARHEWRVVVEFLRETDPVLLERIARKMINHLSWSGVQEAKDILRRSGPGTVPAEQNRPLKPDFRVRYVHVTAEAFQMAEQHLSDNEILQHITTWIKEDKTSYLVRALETQDTPLGELIEAVERFRHGQVSETELSRATQTGIRVSLIRRFFSESLDFINVAKSFGEVRDFYELLDKIIFPPRSHGKLGGKSAGLWLAKKILDKAKDASPAVREVKVPKTWYLTSDWILHFIHHNDLEDVLNRKYLDIEQVRQEYPHLVALFKTSPFPSQLANGLAMVLEHVGDRPLIVRSSSLLEDRSGSAFSGKYKSLFLGNQGTKEQNLIALMDAIAEVYASIFGPDPTEYRAERGLLDVHEEMGVMIQEVVGTTVGRYFLPACSGVAFSTNEFRWSARIKRTDGLIRLVPGLGTRAVDRVADDYPVLIAPGQPTLRANVTVDETLRYSPKRVDVINLETNAFETVSAPDLLTFCGAQYPRFREVVSIVANDRVEQPLGLLPDLTKADVVFTFEGLIRNTPFVACIRDMLAILQDGMGKPVDLEFAFDGADLYLLQCRPQSYGADTTPVAIPQNLPTGQVVFSANRFVSNGRMPEITHIVYVELEAYSSLPNAAAMREVGRAVGRLNKLLPKRQFILIGPGRWGSRGDIKLGVPVTYSEINNTAMLVEVARQRGNYLPELSFGTHFFQDLVEASIRYLPLYPDDPQTVFNERFLRHSDNVLQELLPEFEHLDQVIRVIDIQRAAPGMILRVLMNAELDQAVAYLDAAQNARRTTTGGEVVDRSAEDHWRWRFAIAQRIAAQLDGEKFGAKACYLIGSTKNSTAGPASDIDLMIHFAGAESQRRELLTWLDGWSRCLAEINFLRTGYRSDGLLDVHLVTDADIAARTSFAMKIGAVTDAARQLPMKSVARA